MEISMSGLTSPPESMVLEIFQSVLKKWSDVRNGNFHHVFTFFNFNLPLGKGLKIKKKSREFSLSLRPPRRPPSKVGNLFMIFFYIQGSNLHCFLMQFMTFGTRE